MIMKTIIVMICESIIAYELVDRSRGEDWTERRVSYLAGRVGSRKYRRPRNWRSQFDPSSTGGTDRLS